MMSSASKLLERIKIVDDDPSVREAYSYPVIAADMEPVTEDGPLGELDEYLQRLPNADAAVSDYQLSPNGYAHFDGARLVSAWYKKHFPAILCTTFEKSNRTEFRALRRWLPVVMSPDDLTPETLMKGLEYAQAELQDEFSAMRRPWRALIHFVEHDPDTRMAYVKLPGWGTEAVSIRMVDLPAGLSADVQAHADHRCYAVANLGATSNHELYISEWESK